MKVLVTGAGGLIGSHLVDELLNAGHDVIAMIRPAGRRTNLEHVAASITIIEADMTDIHAVTRAMSGCHVCFHTGALVSPQIKPAKRYFQTNIHGTMAVCQAAMAAGVTRLIYTSSCVTLGYARHDEILTESAHPPIHDILGDYGKSKYLAEKEVMSAIAHGLPAIILNPTAVMGPRDINRTPGGAFILSHLKHRLPGYFETGFNIVDVRDVAKAHMLALEKGTIGERYLVGHHNVMLSTLFDELHLLTGIRPPFCRIPYPVAAAGAFCIEKITSFSSTPKPLYATVRKMKRPYFFSSEKARHQLGWEPQIALSETLRDALDWYRQQGWKS